MTEHYYGDVVRKFLIVAAVIMAASLPFWVTNINKPLFVSILAIVAVSVAAALTSPRFFWSIVVDVVISVVALVMFEYDAVTSYVINGGFGGFFFVNQILAIIFLIALYYSLKTVRGWSGPYLE